STYLLAYIVTPANEVNIPAQITEMF
nr:membrane alanyl aminopeptidase (EC 3.4.11.2) - bovine (fragments) [Bos taurus]